MMDIQTMTGAQIGRAIEGGKLDPVEVADVFLEAIKLHPDGADIYSDVTEERARTEALAARERAKAGTRRGPLDGVPLSWKDVYDMEGQPAGGGTPLLSGRVSGGDARALKIATDAGTVCLGRTHITEFTFSGIGVNPATATPPNRLMPGHVPGGSSSGAAASVKFDLAPIAVGTDTGGSVRIPACWNSLVGLKTTYGLLSLEGTVASCVGFDTVGPIAKTVEDAALLFTALGGDAVDLSGDPDLAGLKLGVVGEVATEVCDPEVLMAFEAALARVRGAGAQTEDVAAIELTDVAPIARTVMMYQAWNAWGHLVDANPGVVSKPLEDRFLSGKGVTKAEHDAGYKALMELREKFWANHKDYDALVFPTLGGLPPTIDAVLNDPEVFPTVKAVTLRNTRHVNIMGGCAVTLPVPEPCIGFQIVGNPFSEARILKIASALERIVNP
jgi:aspartyl-tRNA(Asn)/glutamyl-tRNA(Gln) amidotransferase subunit A